ncbi:unnamed protein product [Fusarium graminearum]|uniref:Chromosome 2, complete genome n=1 Tax=Gibberella zeae (strain ATCC MYA-4620 / CBS 123657 / FGSC 9075 / NRRL 31084 / PH-1) TaxID=229533 RepID=I1S6V6_GIBZE|nr:hypothetical protein FGSG_12579 [Fusarium graminearum PH-1]EYB21439.1 hypothetical protein FG05_12579 [Fusarium graminearum]ESU10541.1 hypothetical protein FGSG_12579 [Fusarium graminearum PH-1]CEF77445.1 unnamed protein product [Fusarium graminearum]CZS80739.1 unnamed protein product [Fusarium graminearum]VTO90670.1 unnamed protein product [Fusarium graminearum]|eukprot:XP_011323040.1 hypothetical protein FGSG_12579 [Fusarium graminearum PH-1]
MKMRLYGAVREAPLVVARGDDDACLCNYLPTLSYKPRSGFGNVLTQLLSASRFKAQEHQLKQVQYAVTTLSRSILGRVPCIVSRAQVGSTFDLGDCFRTEGAQPQAGSFGSSSTTAKPTPLIKTINVRNGLAHLTVETTPATPTLIND